jgi:hypothetical protein
VRRFWTWLIGPAPRGDYWDGVEAGIGLGERFERDRSADIIRALFEILPETTFNRHRLQQVGEYLIDEIEGRNNS